MALQFLYTFLILSAWASLVICIDVLLSYYTQIELNFRGYTLLIFISGAIISGNCVVLGL